MKPHIAVPEGRLVKMNKTISALMASLLETLKKEETAWLLERGQTGRQEYLTVRNGGVFEWTTDPNMALRLARREDAEMLAEIVEDADRVCEHQWG